MDPTWIIIALISLIFSALFSGTEIAFVTSNRVRVELDMKKGGFRSRIINRFYSDPEFFISTILVGNNIVLVIYGMAAAALLDPWLEGIFHNDALVLLMQTIISTAVILLTGEFLPKTIFRINPNSSLKVMAVPISFFYFILYPISLFTSGLSKLLMRLCGIKVKDSKTGMLSVGDLNQYLETTIDDIEEEQKPVENEVKIFHNALDFSSTHLRDCMIPRNEIFAVDINETTREQLSELFTTSGRSKIVVYNEDIDNVLGYIHVSELFDPQNDWKECLKPVVFAPETLLANKMMRRLLSEKRSIAIVIDEFGGTAGMVTLEDLVEEIFGDIQDEHDKSGIIEKEIAPGEWEFSGRAEIAHINDKYHLDIPEDDEYQTLAGYILVKTGEIPAENEKISLGEYEFEILKKSANRLELIKVKESGAGEKEEK
ncbi:MAG: HlyC/CorC family transporter [Muribaculaceae bacterium]|nr:HlyC/CorC family transporter [Muribaculaceae bacterium]